MNSKQYDAWFYACVSFTPMQRLRSACQYWTDDRLSSSEFVAAIRECFRDDNGEDWIADETELQRFANSIIDGE